MSEWQTDEQFADRLDELVRDLRVINPKCTLIALKQLELVASKIRVQALTESVLKEIGGDSD